MTDEEGGHMKKLVVGAILLSLFSLPAVATAAGKTHSGAMQVSFVVQDACVVQAAAPSPMERPAVSCEYDSPYTVKPARQQAAASGAAADQRQAATSAPQPATAQEWTVYF
jgi:hypothetical protein